MELEMLTGTIEGWEGEVFTILSNVIGLSALTPSQQNSSL